MMDHNKVELKLKFLQELKDIKPVLANDAKYLNESIRNVCRSISSDLDVGQRGSAGCADEPVSIVVTPTPTPPPTIKERLLAAISDPSDQYSIVHCYRMEGSTAAAAEIAREDKRVGVMSRPNQKSDYDGVAWMSCEGRYSDMFEERNIHTIITDVIPEEKLLRVLSHLRPFDIKVVALKNISK